MKKFLIILCCVALLLPVVALSAFAEDTVSVPYTGLSANSYFYVDSDRVYLNSNLSTGSVTVPVGRAFCLILSAYNGSGRFLVSYVDSDGITISLSESEDSPTFLDLDHLGHFVFGASASSTTSYYVIFDYPAAPFAELGVDDGVDSSISYTGQVLHFLSTNSTTLVLIGLSVAMFAVLPFAISKIKQIIKGY